MLVIPKLAICMFVILMLAIIMLIVPSLEKINKFEVLLFATH